MIHTDSGKRGSTSCRGARGRLHREDSYGLGGIEMERRGGNILAHHWGLADKPGGTGNLQTVEI